MKPEVNFLGRNRTECCLLAWLLGTQVALGLLTNWVQIKAESTALDRRGLALPPKCLSLSLLYFLSF